MKQHLNGNIICEPTDKGTDKRQGIYKHKKLQLKHAKGIHSEILNILPAERSIYSPAGMISLEKYRENGKKQCNKNIRELFSAIEKS
jgi:hypothetical protein